ncbi:MAG: endonuclease III [Planctomycetes bacterium]|nr:endonuclease III [Planctomycetota bacterium]
MATERRRPAPSAKAVAVNQRFGPLSTQAVTRIFNELAERIVPRSDLNFSTPFELLVAVVLSAHTTDRSVNAATATLFPVANTPKGLVALGVGKLLPYIRAVGLANQKARNVAALSQQLLDLHGGSIPSDRESLEALPGVGRKTANVVLNMVFGQPTIAVDTHVHRVANRLGLSASTTPEQTEEVLLARVPRKHLVNAHHYLLLHGRYTCIARRPECWRCPVARWCLFPAKTERPADASET